MPDKTSIIVPTYNEAENIKTLIEGLFQAAKENEIELELVIVDDNSPDNTAEIAEELKDNYNIIIVKRLKEKGLATAVLKGFDTASNEVIGVMDADLSHDPKSFPLVVSPILKGEAELTVGSRLIAGGAIEDWGIDRKIISGGAKLLARPLTSVKDPMSGFFFTKKTVLERGALNPTGYKILLEVLVKCKPKNVVEVPITFKDREKGESKLNAGVQINYLKHLMRLYSHKLGLI